MELYDWQVRAIKSYSGKGIIKAVTGSGKSLVGKLIAQKIGGNILIASHRMPILDQWRIIMKGIKNVQFLTFNVLCKRSFNNIDLLIVDEVHRSTSQEFVKLYDNVQYKNILGLTATPNTACIEKCGDIFCEVGFDEANISPFIVKFVGINLTPFEMQQYKSLSYSIGKIMQKESKDIRDKKILEAVILKRRRIVYNAINRIPRAMYLIKTKAEEGRKILVICQRIDQVELLSKCFEHIPHIVYHSKQKDDLERYKSGEVKLCLSVGMLKEGFDDPDTDVGIVVSTTLSEAFNIQAIGRIIRHKPNKFAEVYILIANNTTDMKVLDFSGNYDFKLENIVMPDTPELREEYYSGDKYSFLGNEIWKRMPQGRIYMKPHDITKILGKAKPAGGSFVLTKHGVLTKLDDRIIRISKEYIVLQPRSKPLVVEDMGKFLKDWE